MDGRDDMAACKSSSWFEKSGGAGDGRDGVKSPACARKVEASINVGADTYLFDNLARLLSASLMN